MGRAVGYTEVYRIVETPGGNQHYSLLFFGAPGAAHWPYTSLLGGSWVATSGVLSPLIRLVLVDALLITPLL